MCSWSSPTVEQPRGRGPWNRRGGCAVHTQRVVRATGDTVMGTVAPALDAALCHPGSPHPVNSVQASLISFLFFDAGPARGSGSAVPIRGPG